MAPVVKLAAFGHIRGVRIRRMPPPVTALTKWSVQVEQNAYGGMTTVRPTRDNKPAQTYGREIALVNWTAVSGKTACVSSAHKGLASS